MKLTSDHQLLQETKVLCKEAWNYHCHDLCVCWKWKLHQTLFSN